MIKPSRTVLVAVCCMLALACRIPVGGRPVVRTPSATQSTRSTPSPAAPEPVETRTLLIQPTFTPTVSPTRPTVITPSPTITPVVDPHLSQDDVLILPWPLYEGDHVSVDVDPELAGFVGGDALVDTLVTLAFADMGTFTTTVSMQGLDDIAQARFYWTAALTDTLTERAGAPDSPVTVPFTLSLILPQGVVDPDYSNNTLVLPVKVYPREALLPPEPSASWTITDTAGFRLHYLTDSTADRDLALLLDEAHSAYVAATARLDPPEDPVDIYLMDRVIGQGGYATSQWVAVTHTDRRYAPVTLSSVLHHELIHRLDDAIGCDSAPSLLREGLAVYLSGGHYRPEPLRQKAQALLATPHYVPLDVLVKDFYVHQHEVAYLEAGALVAYIDATQGWDALVEACRATADVEGDDTARWEVIKASLGAEEATTLEQRWRAWLRETSPGTDTSYDTALLELELRLMDAMRAYQATYDPAAHFLYGILFSPAEAERLEIVADFVRRPRDPVPIGFELVLSMGQEAVERQDTTLLALLVEDVEMALVEGSLHTVFVRDAIEIAELALRHDWEPSRLLLAGGTYAPPELAHGADRQYLVDVVDRQAWPQQVLLSACSVDGEWEIEVIMNLP